MLLKYLEHQMHLLEEVEVVDVVVETHKEFLLCHVSFFSYGELLPDMIGVGMSNHAPMTSPAHHITSAGISGTQELSPTDSLIQDVSILNEQVHLSDDEDSENDHLPKADSRKDWWKPLPEEERPATPEPT
nr:hypothetical protein [Tanacetum cinerariifolium]